MKFLMKRSALLLLGHSLVLMVLLSLATTAQAKMLYYTYDGVYAYVNRSSGTSNSQDIQNIYSKLGSAASYTFAIDLDYITQEMQTNYSYESNTDEHFGYVGGTATLGFSSAAGWSNTPHYSIRYEVVVGSTGYGDIVMNTEEYTFNSSSFTLQFGRQFRMREHLTFNTNGDESDLELWSYISLTSISETNPYATPIPPAALLLGVGLAGLAGLRRRFRQ